MDKVISCKDCKKIYTCPWTSMFGCTDGEKWSEEHEQNEETENNK